MTKQKILIGALVLITIINSVVLFLGVRAINNQAVVINNQGAALRVMLATPEIKGPVEAEAKRQSEAQ